MTETNLDPQPQEPVGSELFELLDTLDLDLPQELVGFSLAYSSTALELRRFIDEETDGYPQFVSNPP